MITQENIERLDNLVKKYAKQDYERANPHPYFGRRHNPYTLSPLTNEAREMLQIALKENITKEEEESIKGYLLKKKMLGEEDY